jgi:hypothetical protein
VPVHLVQVLELSFGKFSVNVKLTCLSVRSSKLC